MRHKCKKLSDEIFIRKDWQDLWILYFNGVEFQIIYCPACGKLLGDRK
jgi:hypothetical protein